MINVIVAVDEKWGIGKNNQLPFHNKEDLNNFKELTQNSLCLMGRKTFDSIINRNGHPLKNRKCIVLTRDINYKLKIEEEYGPLIDCFTSLNECLNYYKNDKIWVIGGSQIYKQILLKPELVSEIYISFIPGNYECTEFFPFKLLENFKLKNLKRFVTFDLKIYGK